MNNTRNGSPSRKYLTWSILGLTLLAIVGAYAFRKRNNVEYASPIRQPILEAIYGLGKVKAKRHFELKIGVLATANEVYIIEGQSVKRGDRLIRFEGAPFHAPFDGTVTVLDASSGETVVPNVPVLRIDDLSEQYVEVALEQQGALRVRPGMNAKMTFDTVRGNELTGKVLTVFSRNDEFLAHIGAGKFPDGILPGMTADVVIEVGMKPNALLVPLNSIQEGRVIAAREGGQVKVPIEVGIVDGQWAEVLKGELREDDRLVVPSSKKQKQAETN